MGHGNSTIGRNLGKVIDSFDGYVVRFPSNNWQSRIDYGWKTDYVVATVDRRRRLPYDKRQPTLGVWIYPFPHVKKARGELIERTLLVDSPVVVCFDEILPWLDRYLALQDRVCDAPFLSSKIKEVTDDHKYRHFSVGTGAVIIAAQKVEGIKEILLLGCDNLWKGTRSNFGRCNLNPAKVRPTAHNFRVERLLLDEVSSEYGIEVRPL